MRASMNRKGDCWDNAVAESLFASLKNECVYRYNHTRLYSTLGYLSLMIYERKWLARQRAAAA